MSLLGQHILSTQQFTTGDLDSLFELADLLEPVARGFKTTRILEGAVLANLFFEPSTRTRISFDSAFSRLGGSVSHTTGFNFSSIVKGESLHDTSRVVSGYADVIVIRHPTNGAITEFAESSQVPIINGGCGSEEHPTQSLLDLYTIKRELKRAQTDVRSMTIAFVGDLKYGRTVHSLVKLLAQTRGIHYIFISPPDFKLPLALRKLVEKTAASVRESDSFEKMTGSVDVLYTTRIQRERMTENDAIPQKSNCRITLQLCNVLGIKCLMHPLPRNSQDTEFDLGTELDNDPRLAIFRQTDNGIQIRMALFCKVMGVDEEKLRLSLKDANWQNPVNYCT